MDVNVFDLGILSLSVFVNSYKKAPVNYLRDFILIKVIPDTQDLCSMPRVPLTMPGSPGSLSHLLVGFFIVYFLSFLAFMYLIFCSFTMFLS